jgi:hypothetical protein
VVTDHLHQLLVDLVDIDAQGVVAVLQDAHKVPEVAVQVGVVAATQVILVILVVLAELQIPQLLILFQ